MEEDFDETAVRAVSVRGPFRHGTGAAPALWSAPSDAKRSRRIGALAVEGVSVRPPERSSDLLGGLDAVGDRVVHGGARFSDPVLLDARAEYAIEELAELAPLYNGPALAAIRAIREALGPEMPQVATFDTAFHSRMPRVARLFALPRRLAEEGVLASAFTASRTSM